METIRLGGRAVHGFALGGTIFGNRVDDLDKLIKNKDVEMASMGAEVAKPNTDPSIRDDFAALSKAYQAARAAGIKVISDSRNSVVPEILQPVDSDAAFKAIIAALQPVEHQVTAGSMQDIAARLAAAGWKPTYKLPFQYQSDAVLTFYSGLTTSAEDLRQAGHGQRFKRQGRRIPRRRDHERDRGRRRDVSLRGRSQHGYRRRRHSPRAQLARARGHRGGGRHRRRDRQVDVSSRSSW